MSVTFLRHEERPEDNPLFFTELTEAGFKRSQGFLVDRLYFTNPPIDTIYCSPLLRAIQTVAPFAQTAGIKLRVEGALYEFMDNPLYNETNCRHDWPDLPEQWQTLVDRDYQPVFPVSEINFRESWVDCQTRTNRFIDQLIQENSNTKKTNHYLIVSHMTTINSCLTRWDTTREQETPFPIGGVRTVQLTDLLEKTH